MGEYLDLFVEEIKNINDKFKEDILREEIGERIAKYWQPIPDTERKNFDVQGVDSSYQSLNLTIGYTLVVVRAIAVGKSERRRILKAYLTTGELNELSGRIMENLEHEILLSQLKDVNLVDGSLYGRANHIPREFRNDGFEDFTLRYYRNYVSLIEKVAEKNLKIIGISKSTSTTFLRDIVVKEMYDEEAEKYGFGEDERRLPYLALDRKNYARKMAKKLLKDRGYERAYSLIMELTSKRPDTSILSMLGRGMSRPVLLGASARARRRYEEISREGKRAVEKMFPNVDVKDEDVEIILKYLDMSTFISFYISFIPGVVMRVDFPAFIAGINKSMMDVTWPQVVDVKIDDILAIVVDEYGGLPVHSIHLYSADNEVRFERETFMNVYLPALLKNLDLAPALGDMRYLFRR